MLALGSLLLSLSPLQVPVQDAPRLGAFPDEAAAARPETWTTILSGYVLDAAGRPAEGAVVLTSAGGQAVCDAQGAYRFAVEVPFGARELHLTAALGTGAEPMVASVAVDLDLLPPSLDVRPLTLAADGSCSPAWLPTFGEYPGTNNTIYAMAVHDDGSGPALYVGGDFQAAGAVLARSVARWDGTHWSALSDQLEGIVYALEVFDDGNGAQLYAGGAFQSQNPSGMNNIARWDGASWHPLAAGTSQAVRALTVFDDGSGPALYAGGAFSFASGVQTFGVARWDGTSWSALGAGVFGTVYAMTVHTDVVGTWLCVGGDIYQAGGLSVNNLARWSGSAWSALGAGVNNGVYALASYDSGDGSGAKLYAGGRFSQASGNTAHGLAVMDSISLAWTAPFALTPGSWVYALDPTVSASGSWLTIARVYGGSGYLARWSNGSSFLPVVQSNGPLYAAEHFDSGDGHGVRTYAAGRFPFVYQPFTFESVGAGCVYLVDGDMVEPLGTGMDNEVTALAVHDDGTGPALYAAGFFLSPSIGTAKWDGNAWVNVPLMPVYGGVQAMLSYQGVSGPELVAGGEIPSLGFLSSEHVVRYSNGVWSGMNLGMNDHVLALAAWEQTPGAPEVLYAGGLFTTADGNVANRLAHWDGVAWGPVGGGANGPVRALAVFDDGSGEALYVAGDFTQVGGSLAANRIARWDGSSWSTLGGGMDNRVTALGVFDDGPGAKLYAGGRFTTAGGVIVNGLAAWDGASWSPLGAGLGNLGLVDVDDFEVFDDGTGGGPALYASGTFFDVDGLAVNGVARWDGSAWSALDSGVIASVVPDLAVLGDSLYAGGAFLVSPGGDSMLARWEGCGTGTTACTPSLSGPTSLVADLCGTVDGAYQLTSDGSLGAGTWSLEYGPSFPSFDGWSATLVNSTDTATHIEWITEGTSTGGIWLLLLTWTGTCNGLPVEWTFDVSCNLLQACPPAPPITAYCFGDGSGTACPCGNNGAPGTGCANSLGFGAVLSHSGSSSIAAHDLVLTTTQAIPGKLCLYYQGTTPLGSLKKNLLSDGILCIGGSLKKLQSVTTDPNGASSTSVDLAVKGMVQPGDVRYYQAWYRDVAQSPCGYAENRSNALEVHWVP